MAGGGGAWKVAYADFVTAMMAFFMVMWLTSQSEEVKKAIGGYFQDPWGTSQESNSPTMQSPSGINGNAPFGDATNGVLPNRYPQANLENATEKEQGAASVWQQKQKVFLLNSSDRNLPALVVKFDDGSAELSATAKQRLTDLLPALMGKQNKIELRAHSTRRPLPMGSHYRDHWQLCYSRSVETMDFLLEHGIEPDRLRLSQTASYDPLSNRLEESFQNENNCVEVFMLTEMSGKSPGGAPADKSKATATTTAKAH